MRRPKYVANRFHDLRTKLGTPLPRHAPRGLLRLMQRGSVAAFDTFASPVKGTVNTLERPRA